MDIVGGTYRELCEIPSWDEEFGSGGRAAAMMSAISSDCVLHTYSQNPNSRGLNFLRSLGVKIRVSESTESIAFAYFHPLSRPHIEPPLHKIVQQPPIIVDAETVLRFGFLEGDAIVKADRAIYDPQTSNNPSSFHKNGSTAKSLALVINENELRAFAKLQDCNDAAKKVIKDLNVDVLVVKRGAKGARVFESSGSITHVSAYRSSKVFKIGTGDVFSAIFAHYWGKLKISAHEAAVLASKGVSLYCSNQLTTQNIASDEEFVKIVGSLQGPILLLGCTDTLGGRYVMEEARFQLQELGAKVISPNLQRDYIKQNISSILVVGERFPESECSQISSKNPGTPIIYYSENSSALKSASWNSSFIKCDEFVSAIYFSIWAAMA